MLHNLLRDNNYYEPPQKKKKKKKKKKWKRSGQDQWSFLVEIWTNESCLNN